MVGGPVAEDQAIAAIQTDKATVEIPSPVSGTVVGLGGSIGSILAVGAELIRVETAGDERPATDAVDQDQEPATKQPEPAVRLAPASQPVQYAASAPISASSPPRSSPATLTPAPLKPLGSPAVRRRAQDAGLDLRRISGTGPAGRIEHADLDAALRGDTPLQPAHGAIPKTGVTEIKVTGLRRVIARRIADSTRNIAHSPISRRWTSPRWRICARRSMRTRRRSG